MAHRPIQAIDKGVVHKICSGQVVLDVSTAVKELVENALDAGGDRVDVRLVDCGLTCLEVSDNGSGIRPEDYDVLAVKHTTSKIAVFSDLESVQSFGFRGEALSSLCAIGDGITVSTRTATQTMATKLVYDRNGVLVSRSPCARKQGTTVTVTKLFSSLPVRLKDFELNKPRELHRTIKRVQSYALVCINVKFNFVSVDGSRTSTILTTQGSAKVRDNFCTVFSAKQAEMLADFVCSGSDWQVIGLMSKPVPNAGMASAERQFLFLNDRPIDFPKITRVCNEMYRRVSHSHPVFVLNIVTPAHNVDVNLTPDKRTVLLHNESEIISTMQATLKLMFEPTVQVFQVQTNTLDAFSTKTSKTPCSSATAAQRGDACGEDVASTSASSCTIAVQEDVIELASSSPCDSIVESCSDQHGIACMVPHPRAIFHASSSVSDTCHVDTISGSETLRASISDANTLARSDGSADVSNVTAIVFSDAAASQCHLISHDPAVIMNASPVAKVATFDIPRQHNMPSHCSGMQPSTDAAKLVDSFQKGSLAPTLSMFSNFARGIPQGSTSTPASISSSEHRNFVTGSNSACKRNRSICTDSESDDSETNPINLANLPSSRAVHHPDSIHSFSEADDQLCHPLSAFKNKPLSKQTEASLEQDYLDDQAENNIVSEKTSEFLNTSHAIPAVSVSVDWTKLIQQVSSGIGPMNSSGWKMWGASNSDQSSSQSSGGECLNSDQFKNCLNGLSHGTILTDRKIDKADFTRMEVLGQFNKGFIIARLLDDMYIIDQHASDEKCRFEMLQRNTVLRTQPLIAPLSLDLSPGDEEILEQRAAIFSKSGFNFQFDDSERPGRRARLITVPFSHNVQLGPADVQEMLFLLKDNVCQLCRPSRITSMFASRACRSAIMIGDSLPLPQMRKILHQLSRLDQPWNCPHGRPTMRHLFDLNTCTQPSFEYNMAALEQ